MTTSMDANLPFPDAQVPTYADSIRGALLGLALGDALGYPLELLSAQDILNHDSASFLAGEQLTVSDDTQLTLYTLDGLTEVLEWNNDGAAADEIACIWLALLRWYRAIGKPFPENAPFSLNRELDSFASLRCERGPGKATLAALASGDMQLMDKNMNPDALGSGALVRATVLGFLPVPDAGTVTGLASRQAALTHGHAEAIISACAQALLVRYCLAYRGQERPVRQALLATLAWFDNLPIPTLPEPSGLTSQALETALTQGQLPQNPADLKTLFGNLWLAPAVLGCGVLAALGAEEKLVAGQDYSALKALEEAACQDGDSDSTAAICGALLGAAYGSAIFPAQLVEKLDVLDAIDYLFENWKKQLGI